MSLKKEIERYSNLNGYLATSYEELICDCGNKEFHLYSDDEEGGAYAVCGFILGGTAGALLYAQLSFQALYFPAGICLIMAAIYRVYVQRYIKVV